jgi:hypothetical protein
MKVFFLATLAVLGVGTYYFFQMRSLEQEVAVPVVADVPAYEPQTTIVQMTNYGNQEFDFNFTYRDSPFGYLAIEKPSLTTTVDGSLFEVTLMRHTDYARVIASRDTDGPPTIQVSVYRALAFTDVDSWLLKNALVTNCEEGEIRATVVDGKDASGCRWDGLYVGMTIALLQGEYVYMLTGTVDDPNAENQFSYEKDFDAVVASFVVGE